MKLNYWRFIPAIIWLAFITTLLVLPGPDVPSSSFLEKIYFDKLVHFSMFGGLTLSFIFPFIKSKRATLTLMITIAVISILYGISMEYVQKYIAFERDFDVHDMIADGIGSIIGLLAAIKLKDILTKREQLKKISPCRNRGRNQN